MIIRAIRLASSSACLGFGSIMLLSGLSATFGRIARNCAAQLASSHGFRAGGDVPAALEFGGGSELAGWSGKMDGDETDCENSKTAESACPFCNASAPQYSFAMGRSVCSSMCRDEARR